MALVEVLPPLPNGASNSQNKLEEWSTLLKNKCIFLNSSLPTSIALRQGRHKGNTCEGVEWKFADRVGVAAKIVVYEGL